MSQSVRSTQRAPKSCTACYRRKIKCSKGIPCQQCVDRGCPDACKLEVVNVKGQLRTAETPNTDLSYEELLQENFRLRGLVAGHDVRPAPDAEDEYARLGSPRRVASEDPTQRYEMTIFEMLARAAPPRTVRGEQHILMPSRFCSDRLVEHAVQWTCWIHFAVLTPTFRREHAEFWATCRGQAPFADADPLWMAVYFSMLASTLIFMGEDDLAAVQPPASDYSTLLLNWYEAALWFLSKGEFMRWPHVRTVQTIAILGIVFNNVADVHLHRNLRAVAIRVAQQLDLGSDAAHTRESYAEQQSRRRLWWTLVICDWLAIPYGVPSINDAEFDCKLPDNVDDEELDTGVAVSRLSRSKPRPVQYHIVMSKVARIYHQLQYRIRIRRWSSQEMAGLVIAADNQLANVIEELPVYINFGRPEMPADRRRDTQLAWIPWQRKNLQLLLLSYRIGINRLLQGHWHLGSIQAARTRNICLNTACAIIKIVLEETVDESKLKTWHFAINVFGAAATLAIESRASTSAGGPNFSTDLEKALQFLKRIAKQNPVAEHSIPILISLIGEDN